MESNCKRVLIIGNSRKINFSRILKIIPKIKPDITYTLNSRFKSANDIALVTENTVNCLFYDPLYICNTLKSIYEEINNKKNNVNFLMPIWVEELNIFNNNAIFYNPDLFSVPDLPAPNLSTSLVQAILHSTKNQKVEIFLLNIFHDYFKKSNEEKRIETSENLNFQKNYPKELNLKEGCIWNAPLPKRQENHFFKSISYLLNSQINVSSYLTNIDYL